MQPDTSYLHFIRRSIFHCFPTCISSPHTPSYLPTYLTTHLPYYLPVFYWAQYLPLFSNVYSLTSSTTSSRICLPVEQHRMTNSNVNASCISWAGVWFFGGQYHWSVTLCLEWEPETHHILTTLVSWWFCHVFLGPPKKTAPNLQPQNLWQSFNCLS